MSSERIIIGLAGAAGAGKDTAADYLVSQHGFMRMAFADPLREMLEPLLRHLTGEYNVDAWLYGRDRKERPLPHIDASPRRLMQTLGTEWGRNLVHPEIWTRVMRARIGDAPWPRLVITDVRFPNEAALIRECSGEVWRVLRDVPGMQTHVSERAIGREHVDATLDNAGTLDDLRERVVEQLGTYAARRAWQQRAPI